MLRLRLTRDTVGTVSRGHPWVYAEGLVAPHRDAGSVVQLVDDRDAVVAFGLADDGPIAVRVLGRHAEPLQDLVRRRFLAARELRRRVVGEGTDAYRLVNGEGDRLGGLVLDRYGPLAVLRLYAAAWEPHISLLVDAFRATWPGLSLARRLGVRNVDGDDGLVHLDGPPVPEPIVVTEHGLRFLARPSSGQKTGLFLDQRENRAFLARVLRGSTVLNLFAYTGGFSVHAAAGGARRVITVDVSEPALLDARENFALNGLDPGAHGFVATDAFTFRPDEAVDAVICDPPSLSHNRKADPRARTAYRDLAAHTAGLLGNGGLLATASCTARLTLDDWTRQIRDGVRRSGRWAWLHTATEPPDHPVLLEHPEGRYLKFALLTRQP